tara:strand:- start:193 stop:450 length:258 start_codon:yes stop_codon:yes gene_type:complete
MDNEKQIEYAAKLVSQIQDMFKEDSENSIDLEDLQEGDNLKHFFHALLNTMPTYLCNKLTSSSLDVLANNHRANRLILEYSKKEK